MIQSCAPQIRKAALVRDKTLIFCDATVEDAELILNLGTDANTRRVLSATSNSLEAQQTWLQSYTASTGHAYFIKVWRFHDPLGAKRVGDSENDYLVLTNGEIRKSLKHYKKILVSQRCDHPVRER